MITRAQAEALLTLAESLEACERLGIALVARYYTARLDLPGLSAYLEEGLNGSSVRSLVAGQIPT